MHLLSKRFNVFASQLKSCYNANKKLGAYMNLEKIKEFFFLMGLSFVVKVKELIEYIKVVYSYYRNLPFAKADIGIILTYFFDNPFSVSKRFFKNYAYNEEFIYGETPLTTFDKIAKLLAIKPHDKVYELGCGRGRTCFFLKSFYDCQVVGVDLVKDFIIRAKRIQRKLKIEGLSFKAEDFLSIDLHDATIIYLYGTCLETATIERLILKFNEMPAGTKIVTVSYALNEYEGGKNFEIMKCFTSPFTWGEADVFIQIKK